MLHAPWTVHTDPNPTDPILIGFRIRDARGVVVAEIFNRPYPVVVDRAHADALAAAPQMLAALRLAKPVCADAYYDALAVQENPSGDALNHPAENAQATAAALAAWEAVNAAINLAEGRTTDAPEADPAPTDFEQRRDGWLIAFIPISSAARQWSIDRTPKSARWEHGRWYASRGHAPGVRREIEAEGFTVQAA